MSTADVARAGRREWIGLAVLLLACLVYAMDLTVLQLALPQLSEDLEPSSVQLLWIADIYGFMVAGALITMGTLGDRPTRLAPKEDPASTRGRRRSSFPGAFRSEGAAVYGGCMRTTRHPRGRRP